ncbi:hypothetical protein [Halalkalicoccus ordinarius]|uniref:hypothetical protein n=1 Tax=Halalkalicoccus ordinarius TaxID=3116651 RepID=UPI00300E8241
MILDELAALRTAAERKDRIAIMNAIERLDGTFERDRFESRRFDTMAALLDQPIDRSNDDARNGYRKATIELEQRWIELDRSTLAYVQAEDSSATLVNAIDAVDVAYREREERMKALETAVSAIPMSPMIVVQGDADIEASKGATVGTELVLSVIGPAHPDPITVDVESDISASVSPSVVDGLDENETIPVQVELSPAIAGEFNVVVTINGEMNADRFRSTVRVLAKQDYVDRTTLTVRSLETVLDSLNRSDQWNGLRNQARTLRRRLDSISDDLENRRRPTHSIDNRLNAARNSADAMNRQVSRSGPGVERQEVLYLLESITKQLDDAIEAAS